MYNNDNNEETRMEKRKNRISTFSSPKEYALPKVLPSKRVR